MDVDYHMGVGHRKKSERMGGLLEIPQPPKIADVLNSCFLDAELFDEYGNDPDEWRGALGGDSINEILASIAACRRRSRQAARPVRRRLPEDGRALP